MRVNIEYFIICASLVASVAPGWIFNSGVDIPVGNDEYPVKIIHRRAAGLESAESPKTAPHEEKLFPFAPNAPKLNESQFEQYFRDESEWYATQIDSIRKEHKEKKAKEAARAAAAGEEPRDLKLHLANELQRRLDEARRNLTDVHAPKSAEADSAGSASVSDGQSPAKEVSEPVKTPRAEMTEVRAEIIAAGVRERFNITEAQWKNQQAKMQPQAREIDDDIPNRDGSENVNDAIDPDTFKLLDEFFISLKGSTLKNKVRRSVRIEDELSPGAANWENPYKVGLGTSQAVAAGDLAYDKIASSPESLRSSEEQSMGPADENKDRNRRSTRVCRRVCSWRSDREPSRRVEPKPREAPAAEPRKKPEYGQHNSYLNFPELTAQFH